MSLALYRKYRPGNFSSVAGQPAIVDTLRRQVQSGKVAHAYLFTGSRGTGKTSCAKILAKAVNCLNPSDGDPCGACVCCRGVEDGSLTDVLEIDAASNNGVDSIRVLREEAFYTPAVAAYRVYIIDEVHMLSQSAFNALLKIMEEPPGHVIFILSTTEIHKVLPTIISRCQRFDFSRIDSAVIAKRLLLIAGEEGIPLTESGAHQIARLSDGALRDALSLLDVCRAGGGTIDAEAVAAATGIMGEQHLSQMAAFLLRRDIAGAISLIEQLSLSSLEPGRLCEQLIGYMRNLMLVKTATDPLPLIGCMPHQLEEYKVQAGGAGLSDIMLCIGELGKAQSAMSRTTARRIELELAVVRICSPHVQSGDASLVERIERLEAMFAKGVSAPAQAKLPPEPTLPPAASYPAANPSVSPPGNSRPAKKQPTADSSGGNTAPEPPEAQGEYIRAGKELAVAQQGGSGHTAPELSKAQGGSGRTVPEPPEMPFEAFSNLPEPPIEAYSPGNSPQPPVDAPGADGESSQIEGVVPFDKWPEVLVKLRGINQMNAGILSGSRAYLVGGRVLIDCKDPVFLDMMRTKEETRGHIKEAIYLATGRNLGIGPYNPPEESQAADPLASFVEQLPQDDSIIIR